MARTSWLALALILGCDADPDAWSPAASDLDADLAADGVAPPPDGGLTLDVRPLLIGGETTWTVGGLAPGESVKIGVSLQGTGAGPCPPAMGGECLDILGPVTLVGTAVADGSGVAILTRTLPEVLAPGATIATQAVALRGVDTAKSFPIEGRACATADHPTVGWTAELSTLAHEVTGTAEIVDDCNVVIQPFSYDGRGIDVFLYGGLGGNFGAGFPMTRDLLGARFSGEDSLMGYLPDGKTWDDADGVSVWCLTAGANFGSGTFAP